MTSNNDTALVRFLKRLLRRSPLTREEQAAILALSTRAVQVEASRDIIVPGQETGSACLVVDGMIARFDQMRGGQRQTTALYFAGDMCDLDSVASPVAAWGLQAVATTTILRILHADLRGLAAKYPAVAIAFWRDTVADASVLAKWISNVGRRDARSRLAHLLCEIGVRSEHAGIGSRTDFPLLMTQNQLADALGITSVHVNRTLQALRQNELVTTGSRRIHVERWDELAGMAEFDPRFLLLEQQPNPSTA